MHHIKNDAKFLKQHQNYSNLVKNKNLEISSLQSRDCEIEKNARYLENARSRDLEIKHYFEVRSEVLQKPKVKERKKKDDFLWSERRNEKEEIPRKSAFPRRK